MTTKGTIVRKYLVTAKIPDGRMGAIYNANHPSLNRDVILKRLTLKRSHSIVERFKRKAQLMIDFLGDHIVQLCDHFKEGSPYYVIMLHSYGVY